MKRFVEAGVTDREARTAMEVGVDGPEAIIAWCAFTFRSPGVEGHP